MNTFASTVDMLHRALDAEAVRRQVIANNIANAGVPGFKRSTVSFESELRRALDSQSRRPALELEITHPAHIPNWREADHREVQIRRVLDFTSTFHNNGNNVDPEREVMLSVQNQMRFNLFAQSLSFEFGQVNTVLRA